MNPLKKGNITVRKRGQKYMCTVPLSGYTTGFFLSGSITVLKCLYKCSQSQSGLRLMLKIPSADL